MTPVPDSILVESALTLLAGVLAAAQDGPLTPTPALLERSLLFALTWAIGSLLDSRHRPAFDACLRGLSQQCPDPVWRGRSGRTLCVVPAC